MNGRKFWPAVGTIAIHAVLLALALRSALLHPPAKPQQAQPPDTALQLVGILTKPVAPIIVVKTIGHGLSQRCPRDTHMYQGIGIIYTPFSEIITEIPPFTPAYGAGIRLGDSIRSLHEAKGYIDITVVRNSNTLSFHIKEQTICAKS